MSFENMSSVVLAVLAAVTLAQGAPAKYGGFPKTQGMPWPMPRSYSSEPTVIQIDETLVFMSNLAHCDIIAQAFKRYKPYVTTTDCARGKRTFPRDQQEVTVDEKLISLNVNVEGSCEKWPSPSSDEKYSLIVNMQPTKGKAEILAATVWGALRGLETFSQLVYNRGDGVLQVNSTKIRDSPRFNFRGVMLDAARHFLPVRVLLENLEAMAQNKMNVFHWHIVDDQSFPYVSSAFPQLSNRGSFDPWLIYTAKDVTDVIEFARLRGIRVLPEFDSPGHTQSWGRGQPGLLTPCYSNGEPDGTYGPFNAVLNSTYDFVRTFFGEVSTTFPDQFVHLGGEEVSIGCWESNPDVVAFMNAKGWGDKYHLLKEYYMQNLIKVMADHKRSSIVWQDVFDDHLRVDKKTIVQIWREDYQNKLAAVTKSGYQAVLSSPWYLNVIKYDIDWPQYYEVEPYDFEGSDDQKKLVLGGTVCMWGEYLDATNLLATTWPRASAVAERLWSPETMTDVQVAAPRLEEHRCRMMKRGLTVQPVNGMGYCGCDAFN